MQQLFREFEERQQTETNNIISWVIEKYIQVLNSAIIKEREDRMQSISKVQQQLTELRDEVRESIGQNPLKPLEKASDEVVIWGWLQTWKDGAVKIIEKVIDGTTGHPTWLLEKVAMVRNVIPVKFDTKESAEQFVREQAGRNKNLPHRFDFFLVQH